MFALLKESPSDMEIGPESGAPPASEEEREPRMFTIEQLKDLFYLHINKSEVRTRLSSSEDHIKEGQADIAKL